MTPERFRRIEEVFDAAADARPGEREPVLARLCGDDAELRAEVEALLAACADADDRIRHAIGRAASAVHATPEPPEGRGLAPRQPSCRPHR